MRISDWSSDVCSSDLRDREVLDVVRKLVAHPCLHGVGAGGGTFNDAIAGAVDVVDVVAREAGEGRRHAAVTPEGVIRVASFEKGAGKGGGEVMNGDGAGGQRHAPGSEKGERKGVGEGKRGDGRLDLGVGR